MVDSTSTSPVSDILKLFWRSDRKIWVLLKVELRSNVNGGEDREIPLIECKFEIEKFWPGTSDSKFVGRIGALGLKVSTRE